MTALADLPAQADAASLTSKGLLGRLSPHASVKDQLGTALAFLSQLDGDLPAMPAISPAGGLAPQRRAARMLAGMLDGARGQQFHDALASCTRLLHACTPLFALTEDTVNFGEEAAHLLFSLQERNLIPQLQSDLAALGTPGDLRTSTMVATTDGADLYDDPIEGMHDAVLIATSLSQLPQTRLGDIIGFSCALTRTARLLARGRSRWRYRQCHRVAMTAAEAFANTRHDGERRASIQRGMMYFERCVMSLGDQTRDTPDNHRRRAVGLMQGKARYATLHHRGQSLGGRKLTEWFTEQPYDAEGMLQGLFASPWINRADIPSSRFFTHLTASDGKMASVFSDMELHTLQKYFGALAEGALQSSDGTSALATPERMVRCPVVQPHARLPSDHRERFFILQRAEHDDRAFQLADELVAASLRECATMARARPPEPLLAPFPYASETVAKRIDQLYWHQAERVQSMDFALDEAQTRRLHQYFAPMALVDGCWLQRVSAPPFSSDAHALLARIYSDEIGNGIMRHNHAQLYHELLVKMGVRQEGATHAEYLASLGIPKLAFKAPAFLLALNLSHTRYFPELLGVTLGVEMSGLDGFYEQMIENLDRIGNNPAFWRVHVSVDNYSSGHARQSLNAILAHMEATLALHGPDVAEVIWQRIWQGFQTLLYLFQLELQVLMSVKHG